MKTKLSRNKQKYVIEATALLRDAMALIDENQHRSLIVVSKTGSVAGTLSDGDIRKALLAGRLLESPVNDIMNTNFIALRESERAKAKDIFDRTHVFLIPVVDARARLLDVIEAY